MKIAKTLVLGMAVVLALVATLRADDKKPEPKDVTLKGTIVCAKCGLGEKIPDCENAIQVKDGDKLTTYYLKDEGKGATYHDGVCTASKKGSVTGVVSEEKGKKYITPAKDGVKFE